MRPAGRDVLDVFPDEGGTDPFGSSPGDYCNREGTVASSRGRRGARVQAPLSSTTLCGTDTAVINGGWVWRAS